VDVDARDAHEPAVLAQADVPARLEASLVEPRPRVRRRVQRLDVGEVVAREHRDVFARERVDRRRRTELHLHVAERAASSDVVEQQRRERPLVDVALEPLGQPAAQPLEQQRHRVDRLLGDRVEGRRVVLLVEECDLAQVLVLDEPEPASVGPEEVVEIAERVGVDAGTATAQRGDAVTVVQLDDAHAATVADPSRRPRRARLSRRRRPRAAPPRRS
jgi:hypothetical protein